MSKRTIQSLCLLLILSLLLTFCSGCTLLLSGGKSWSSGPEETADAPASAPASPPKSEEPVPTEAPAGPTQEPPVENSANFPETVLASTGDCTVTAVAFAPDAPEGPTFTLTLENKSNKKLVFSMKNVSVNGYMCDPLWCCEVAAEASMNSDVRWPSSLLAQSGINYLDEVEFTLDIFDPLRGAYGVVFFDTVTIRLENPAAEPPVGKVAYANEYPEKTLFDGGGAKMTLRNYDPAAEQGPTVVFYCENNTNTTLMFLMLDASVNGFMSDPYWFVEVAPGKKLIDDVFWTNEALTKCGINYPEQLEFTLRIYDAHDWNAENICDQLVSLELENDAEGPATGEPVFGYGFTEQVLVESSEVTLIVKDLDPDGTEGPALVIYCENRTDETLTFLIGDVSVNGVVSDLKWSVQVAPGKKAYSDFCCMTPALDAGGAMRIDGIKFQLYVFNSYGYTFEAIVDEVFDLSF